MKQKVNAIRVLAIDMVQRANSGHPGICMGAAPIMYSLFANHLNIDHEDSKSFIRDRFVLSAGHGSAMLYSTLYLSNLGLTIEDLKNFRQLNSKTPGHPEITHTKYVDSTSGPLGQGIAQAVGFSLAKKHNAAKYNKSGNVLNDNTYVLCGDGDLQEGISHEASSLAGHFNLDDLIILWDSNDIQLDSPTSITTSEDVKKRYEAYGFEVFVVSDGEDVNAIDEAINKAKKSDKPTLIEVKTQIGYGSPRKAGTPEAHGAPLGEEEIQKVKQFYDWQENPFEVSGDIKAHFESRIKNRFANKKADYKTNLEILKKTDGNLYLEYINIITKNENEIKLDYRNLGESISTRVASGEALNKINEQIPNLIGGSADLAKSNNTDLKASDIFQKNTADQKNIPFGVREFAMAAITNGINLYGMNKTFCSTFFVFSDYLKPAIRMSAIQNIATTYVLTHDSIAVGEDGPTHEPIEQITGLRSIPNVNVIRPADYNETQAAYEVAINSKKTPTILVLSRQDLNIVTLKEDAQKLHFGAYVLSDTTDFQKVIIATGSEVDLAIKVKKLLEKEGIKVRVVSMPSTNIFDKQPEDYKKNVLGTDQVGYENIYFLEMSTAYIGYKYAKNVINIEKFGKSGKGEEVIKDYNFKEQHIYEEIKNNN